MILRLKDKEDVLAKDLRKIHELELKIAELDKLNTGLEKDKANMRQNYETFKRQQLDKIHTLEDMIKNEKELRQNWCERYERETKILTDMNVEAIYIKSKWAEADSRRKHAEVEYENIQKKLDIVLD